MIINAEIFRTELTKVLMEAKGNNKDYVDVISGDLHRKIGGYPGPKHSMPTCCDVMKSMMKTNDKILRQPPKGKGATLEIRYFL